MQQNTDPAPEIEIRVYKYRWVQLIILCLFSLINTMQLLQFTIISNIIADYYEVGDFLVDLTGLIFYGVNILLFLPVSFLIEKYSLKVTGVVSTALTLIGMIIKIFCSDRSKFYLVLIGQTFCAIGQVYILNIPTKFASTWFGPNEVSTACALAVLGTQLGAAVGSFVPPFLVPKAEDHKEIDNGIHKMTISYAILGAVIFLLVIVVFRGRPKLPPSRSQLQLLDHSEDKPSFWKHCKVLLKNRDYLIILAVFGVINGIWNSFGIVVNSFYINYFPNGETDIGTISLITIIFGGCIGSLFFGYVLDKTHQFRKTSFIVFACICISYIFTVLSMVLQIRIATFLAIPAFGFFIASTLVIAFEFTIEVTYPIPESVSCSILNAFIFFFAIIETLIIKGLMSAFGQIPTHATITGTFIACTFGLLFIDGHLRRRNANLIHQGTPNME